MRYAQVGERFGSVFTLSKAEISQFARLSSDFNPLHHDEEFARQTRFGGIIASGPQTTAHFMGVTASYFSQKGAALGLDFHIRFRKPAYPDDPMKIEWMVVDVLFKEKLGGEIVKLEGTLTNSKGEEVLSGLGSVLVTERL
jgi:acyl dehydratase